MAYLDSQRISCATAIAARVHDNFKSTYFCEHFMNSTDDTLEQWRAQEAAQIAHWEATGSTIGVATLAQVEVMSGLQVFEAMLAGQLPRAPIGQTLDFNLLEARLGEVVFQGQPKASHFNPMGTIHGGWYCTLLDSALGCAVHTTLPAGRAYTTLELKVNLVRALTLKVPLVRAIGKIIHAGNQVATAEASLIGHDGKLYAHATTTCLVFDRRI
jgi:uncharacterized protein (TIGR00369 family)